MAFLAQGATNICKIFVTDYQVINELTGHELWSWGGLGIGSSHLGDNTITLKSSPVQTVSCGTNWRVIWGGSSGIKTDGTLWTWGTNGSGGLGDNTTVDKSSPVQTVAGGTNWRSISNTVAIKTDGTLWTWGPAARGRLGNDTSTGNVSSPVQTIAGGTNWRLVSGNTNDSMSAIKADGTLWSWGYNGMGQLGDNSTVNQSSPVQIVGGGTNWRSISAGTNFAGAIKTDGTLWVWGCGLSGQLGIGAVTTGRSSPVQTISGGTNWKCFEARGNFSGAIKTDGTLWTWGCNANGQLGDNTTVSKSSPVQTVAGGTNWRSFNGSACTGVAIKTDGTVWTWGFATQGRLGDNTTVPKSSPVQIVSCSTNWRSISGQSGNGQTGALRLFSGYDF